MIFRLQNMTLMAYQLLFLVKTTNVKPAQFSSMGLPLPGCRDKLVCYTQCWHPAGVSRLAEEWIPKSLRQCFGKQTA